MSEVLHTIKVEVTEEILTDWNREQSEWTGIDLTPQQMLDIILQDENGGDEYLLSAMEEYETGLRECFLEMLSQHLLGESWTTSDEYSEQCSFRMRLGEAAIARGYRDLLAEDE